MQPQVGMVTIHLFTREKYTIHKEAPTSLQRTHDKSPQPEWREVPWFVACMAYITDFRASGPSTVILRSNDPRAVTCSACKATHEFRRAMEQLPR